MGDPRKFRKKYETPMHPWNLVAIENERKIKRDYGLNRKKEIYVMASFLKKYRAIAKRLSVDDSKQGKIEEAQVLTKLQGLGLLPSGAAISDILSLELKDIMARRLQSVVYRKGFARSMRQARQFITHRHVLVGDKEITSPSYLLKVSEEAVVSFKQKSSLSDEKHPERRDPQEDIRAEAAKLKEETANLTQKEAPAEENTEAAAKTPAVEEEKLATEKEAPTQAPAK